jgi:hypothetical protein
MGEFHATLGVDKILAFFEGRSEEVGGEAEKERGREDMSRDKRRKRDSMEVQEEDQFERITFK